MSKLSIAPRDGKTAYLPGEVVEGVASWQGLRADDRLQIRLAWRTAGKGTVDGAVATTVDMEDPGAEGEGDFQIQLPDWPYSFSGRLVSILWSLEIHAASGASASAPLVMSPTGRELGRIP